MSHDSTDTVWIGMDVHQDSITAAILFGPDSTPQIERLPGDRRKTDRLDAIHLANQDRAGNLVPVTVPSKEQEEIRQLVRSLFAVQTHMVRIKHRIVRVLATHGHRFTGGKSNWTQKHRVWLRKLHRELEDPLSTVLTHHLEHLEYLEAQKNTSALQ